MAILKKVFTWTLPVICVLISVVGFVGYFRGGDDGELCAGIAFVIAAAIISCVNVCINKSGYFDS